MATFIEKVRKKLETFVDDITTLEVTTLSGEINVSAVVDSNNKIDFQKIITQLKPANNKPSTIEIVATTRTDFDKDVVQFIKGNLTPEEIELVKLHNETIKTSQEARKAAMDSLLSIIRFNK